MKKALKFIIALVLIAAVAGGGFFFYITTTPEYALKKTIDDMEELGVEGLKKHLTAEALETIETVEDFTDVTGMFGLFSGSGDVSALEALLGSMAETEWTVGDVLKGKEKCEVEIGFNHKDSVVGTIEITMLKEEGEWKIDGLGMPHFDKVDLARDDTAA